MTATIAYDLSMKNLIDELSGTGHVTHTKHRKTKVTFHHNGGRLSHEGVLNVWRTRPASAHFDIDEVGDAAQYVAVNEYAWATGNTAGNQTSISIEMSNIAGAPYWLVPEITWRRGARLAGWLFARVIGERPHRENMVVHSYWSATACAGPYIDQVFGQMLQIAQQHYDWIISGSEENDMQPTDNIKLVSPGSVARKENPPYSETLPLDQAVATGYFKGSDAYGILWGDGTEENPGLISKFNDLVAAYTDLNAKYENLKLGGVSPEAIKKIAVEAIDEQLGPDA